VNAAAASKASAAPNESAAPNDPAAPNDRTPPVASAPPVASWITPKAGKGVDSDIAGRGLVATEAIASGEVVAVKGGHIVTTEHLRALPELLQNSDIQISDDLHLVALTDDEYEPVMLFLNHSCTPNVGFAGNVVLVAMRDVAAGEELTTDYALFDDYDGSMECHCGTDACRHVIDGRDWMLPQLQERYRGWFSTYLQRRIDGIR
jgi:hypothetical protein